MRYIPLIWAALWRKPVRLVLTLLSVVVAFALFGMMAGFKASFDHLTDAARADRIIVVPRVGGGLPESLGNDLARLPGIKHVAGYSNLVGYYQTARNSALFYMVDGAMRQVWPELKLTPQQYGELAANPTGAIFSRDLANRLKIKKGDTIPLKVPGIRRADGAQAWTFQVLDIIDDIESNPGGFAVGSLKYYDEARVAAARGTILGYRLIIADPTRADATAKLIDQNFANSSTPTLSFSEKSAAENNSNGSGGIDFPFIMESIAGAGLFMILFLAGNSIAQSVRERIPEFAALKTIGFSDQGVMMLVFAEAAIPCLIGAGVGMALSVWAGANFTRILPSGVGFPTPYMSAQVFLLAFACAVLVAFVSAVLPAMRIARLDIAAALSGRT